jgi:RecB family exonuclease
MERNQSPPASLFSPLPDDFSFSQSSLQAFADCPRRFWLTYIQRLPWPAVEAEPVRDHEYLMRLGARFHTLIQRAEIGLDQDLVSLQLSPPLDAWFAAYQTYRPADLPNARVEVERTLSVQLRLPVDSHAQSGGVLADGYRLAAKYDLIAADEDGRVVIVDWKTGRRRPEPSSFQRRLQTLVYLYILVEAAPSLGWGEIAPEQVEMRYWFTAAPNQPISIRYDRAQHAANTHQLQLLIERIMAGRTIDDFALVPDTEANRMRLCRFCPYRSRCNRGLLPGRLDELDDIEDLIAPPATIGLDFTLDDIAEVAF